MDAGALARTGRRLPDSIGEILYVRVRLCPHWKQRSPLSLLLTP
jgi:hypothetical protein